MKVYVWTKKAETRALGLECKLIKAGEPATYSNGIPITPEIAEVWESRGLVKESEDKGDERA